MECLNRDKYTFGALVWTLVKNAEFVASGIVLVDGIGRWCFVLIESKSNDNFLLPSWVHHSGSERLKAGQFVALGLHQFPQVGLRVKPVDIIRGHIVDEDASDNKNMGFGTNKSMLLSAAWVDVAFGFNFNPVEGLLWLVQGYWVEVIETAPENLIASVEIESEWGVVYLFWKGHAAP